MRERTGFTPLGPPVHSGGTHGAVAFRPSALEVPMVDAAVHEAARAAGFAAGYAAGARVAATNAGQEAVRVAAVRAEADAAATAALAAALDALRSAAAAARARTAPVLAEAEALLHAGALELARAVVGIELSDTERSASAALARVLSRPHAPEAVTIHLHPRDLAALRAMGTDEGPEGVELVEDPSLAPGDAVARHPDGYLDARIGAALDRAVAALAGDVR